jgi:hypothetical protein
MNINGERFLSCSCAGQSIVVATLPAQAIPDETILLAGARFVGDDRQFLCGGQVEQLEFTVSGLLD